MKCPHNDGRLAGTALTIEAVSFCEILVPTDPRGIISAENGNLQSEDFVLLSLCIVHDYSLLVSTNAYTIL